MRRPSGAGKDGRRTEAGSNTLGKAPLRFPGRPGREKVPRSGRRRFRVAEGGDRIGVREAREPGETLGYGELLLPHAGVNLLALSLMILPILVLMLAGYLYRAR